MRIKPPKKGLIVGIAFIVFALIVTSAVDFPSQNTKNNMEKFRGDFLPPEVSIDIYMKKGWNTFAIPYFNSSLQYASDILSVIPYATNIAYLNSNGTYVVYNSSTSNNFEINNTRGYMIKVSQDVHIKLRGKFQNEWTTHLYAGWNLLPIYNSTYNTNIIFAKIPHCDFISVFDNINKTYTSIPKDFIYTNLNLNFGDVVFVHLTQSMEYTQYGDQYSTYTVKGLLFYDPTALNYNSSLNALRGDAFIVDENSNIIKVEVNSSDPIAINGTFKIVSINEVNYIYDYVAEQNIVVNEPLQLSTNPQTYGFHNIELSMNAVGITMYNHTFGVCTNESISPSVIFVYLGKTTVFFNDIKMLGVYIPLHNFKEYGIFNISVADDVNNFTIDVPNLSINDFNSNIYLLIVYDIEFLTPETILEGDVMDVYTPGDLATLGALLINTNLNSNGFEYIKDMCMKIDEQIILMLEKDSNNESINFSFIISNRELSKDKLAGMIKLRVYQSNYSIIEQDLGVNFTSRYPWKIHTHLWVCVDNNPVFNSTYAKLNVTELWGLHEQSVNVTGFAIGTNFSTMMDNLRMALQEEDDINFDYLKNFSAFRDPGFVVLIDQNFFSNPGNNYSRLFSLAFVPNYNADNNAIKVLNIKGVVYNISKWFPDRSNQWNAGIPYNIPLIIADSYGDGILDYPEVRLWELNNTYISNNFTKGINTFGWVTGTTMKTIADYASLLFPQLQIVKYSPLDVGVYDVSDRYGNTYYHTALVTFNMPLGDTYLGRHFKIIGIYVDLNNVHDWLQQIYGWCGYSKVYDLLNDFRNNFTVDNSYIHMLNGFIIGLRLIDDPIPTQMKISRIHVKDIVYGGGTTSITVFAYVVNNGLDYHSFLPKMRFFITSPHGEITVMETYRLLATPYFTLNMSAKTPPMTFEEGTYKVEAYLLESVSVAGFSHRTADYATTTFHVRDMTDPFTHAEIVYSGLAKSDVLDEEKSHFYKMYLNREDVLMVKLSSPNADYDVYLYSDSSNVVELSSSTNKGIADEEIWYEAESSGYVYIEVYGYEGNGNYSIWFFKKHITHGIVNTTAKRTPSIYYDDTAGKYIVAYAGVYAGATTEIYINEYNQYLNLIRRKIIASFASITGYIPKYPNIIRYAGYYYCFFELLKNMGVASQWEIDVLKYDLDWNSVWSSPKVVLDYTHKPWNPDVTYANGYFWITYENGNNGDIYVAKVDASTLSVLSNMPLNTSSSEQAAPSIFYMNNAFYVIYSSNAYTDWWGNNKWNLFVEKWNSDFTSKLEWHMIGINGEALNSSEVIDASISYYKGKFFVSYALSKPDWGGLYTTARTFIDVYDSNWNLIQRIPINLGLSNATLPTYIYAGNNKVIVVYADYIQASPGSSYINNVYISHIEVPSYLVSKPTSPQNLKAKSGTNYIYLTWDSPTVDGGSMITEYRIYRGFSPENETYYASVSGDKSYFNDSFVVAGNIYYYYVTAVNGVGESNPSNEVQIFFIPWHLNSSGVIRINSNQEFEIQAQIHEWKGNGTKDNPYIIEGYDIDAQGAGSAIYIGNTTVYFVIQKCHLYNTSLVRWPYNPNAGVVLYNVENGTISDCIINIYATSFDTSLYNRQHIGNFGVVLISSNYSQISNITYYSYMSGDYNFASTVSASFYNVGIYMEDSNHNFIVYNNLSHSMTNISVRIGDNINIYHSAIMLIDSSWDKIKDNDCSNQFLYVKDYSINNEKIYMNSIYAYGTSATEPGYGKYIEHVVFENNNCSNSYFYRTGYDSYPYIWGDVIYLMESRYCVITNNTMINNTGSYSSGYTISVAGLYVYGYYSIFIANNTLIGKEKNYVGMYFYTNLLPPNPVKIYNNTIGGFMHGIEPHLPEKHQDFIVAYNKFIGNSEGIFGGADSIKIFNNTFIENNRGIYLSGGTNEIITNNIFSKNILHAIIIGQNSGNNIIYNNSFYYNNGSNNTYDSSHIQARDMNGTNHWNINGYGNYWSDWTSPDNNGDGIVDNPYVIYGDTNAKDYYPLVNPPAKINNLFGEINVSNIDANAKAKNLSHPLLPHLIYGKVVKSDGITPVTDALFNITNDNTSEYMHVNFFTYGLYIGYFYFDLGNLKYGWCDGNTIRIYIYNNTGANNYTSVQVQRIEAYHNLSSVRLEYGVPLPPRNLQAYEGDKYVHLSWDAPASNGGNPIIEYRIYRDGVLVATVSASQLWYEDYNVSNGKTYSYYVTAVNSVGESEKSNEVQATPHTSISEIDVHMIFIVLIIFIFLIKGHIPCRTKGRKT